MTDDAHCTTVSSDSHNSPLTRRRNRLKDENLWPRGHTTEQGTPGSIGGSQIPDPASPLSGDALLQRLGLISCYKTVSGMCNHKDGTDKTQGEQPVTSESKVSSVSPGWWGATIHCGF